MLGALRGIALRDELEGMMAAQLIADHNVGVDPVSRTGFGFGRASLDTVGLMGGFELGG